MNNTTTLKNFFSTLDESEPNTAVQEVLMHLARKMDNTAEAVVASAQYLARAAKEHAESMLAGRGYSRTPPTSLTLVEHQASYDATRAAFVELLDATYPQARLAARF